MRRLTRAFGSVRGQRELFEDLGSFGLSDEGLVRVHETLEELVCCKGESTVDVVRDDACQVLETLETGLEGIDVVERH